MFATTKKSFITTDANAFGGGTLLLSSRMKLKFNKKDDIDNKNDVNDERL